MNNKGFYVGRVLIGISSERFNNKHEKEYKKEFKKVDDLSEKEFLAFLILSEINNVDPYFRENISFQLSMGKIFFLKYL